MDVTIIGTGYVGLVTGACLAELGHTVSCLDVDEQKIRTLQAGHMPIYEPGLEELVGRERASGRLRFTTRYDETVPHADAVFICVGTPSLPNGQTDTTYLEAAARSIGEHLPEKFCVVVNKSTVPIGSGDWVGMLVRQGLARQSSNARTTTRTAAAAAGAAGDAASVAVTEAPTAPGGELRFEVVSNPEFLREGSAIGDALNPDRIVVGAESPAAIERMRELYDPLLQRCASTGREVPFVVTDRTSAEMVKYAANAFLATKISFVNEIANICEKVGADVQDVARGIGLDNRIGPGFLSAGIGWGGSCFPKDLAALCHTAAEYGYEARILAAAQDVNTAQIHGVVRKLQERLKLVKGKRIALLGIAFKPGTDDVRAAPALTIARKLAEQGAEVRACDPQAVEQARRQQMPAELFTDPYAAAEDADAVILVTEWAEYLDLDWARLRETMRRPLIVDGRNALDRSSLLWHGFDYCGIGR
jgi:UDPglucose 6-dehydrogenase